MIPTNASTTKTTRVGDRAKCAKKWAFVSSAAQTSHPNLEDLQAVLKRAVARVIVAAIAIQRPREATRRNDEVGTHARNSGSK